MAALSREHTGGIIATVCCLVLLITGMVIGAESRSETAPRPDWRAHYPARYSLDGVTTLRRLDTRHHANCAEVIAGAHTGNVAAGCRHAVEVAYEDPSSGQRLHQLVLVYGQTRHADQVNDRFAGRAVAQRFLFASDTPAAVAGELDAVSRYVLVTVYDSSGDRAPALAFHDDGIERLRQR